MPTITVQLEQGFRDAIFAAFGFDAEAQIGISQNEKFGDYQSNAAMGLAKRVEEKTGQKTNPCAVAEQIKGKLNLGEMVQEISIAGPGFINVKLSPAWLAKQLEKIGGDERLGIVPVTQPQTIVVDYSGPNVAKQMHVGHLRSTVLGDAISRLLSFQGHHVIRQNHIGDWGTQFGRVVFAIWYAVMADEFNLAGTIDAECAAWKFAANNKDEPALAALVSEVAQYTRQFVAADPDGDLILIKRLQATKLDLNRLETLYQFISAATAHAAARLHSISHPTHGPNTLEELPRLTTLFIQNSTNQRNAFERLAWEKARQITMQTCDAIYRQLDVQLGSPKIQKEEIVRGESFYNRYLPSIVRELRDKGLARESTEPVEGENDDDETSSAPARREDRRIVVFNEGFKTPLIIQKTDGGYLYGTTDLAGVRFRAQELHANRIIYTHDSRQALHFAQVFATAKRAGWADGVSLEYAPFGTVLGEDGKPFKTRSGDTVKLKDLLDEAEERALAIIAEKNPALDPARQKAIAHAVGIGAVKYFDLSKDRVSDYVFSWEKMLSFDGNTAPYLQNAYVRIQSIFRKAGGKPTLPFHIELTTPHELAVAKHLLRFGDIIEVVARELKPHHLCTYLHELATKYHAFYEHCPVMQSPEPTRSSRLALSDLAAKTLALGLDLLGIEHLDQM